MIRPSLTLLLLLPLVTSLACTDKGDGGADDTGDTSTDGGSSGTTDFEPGCITVDGAGGYAWANDAISLATDGSTVSLADCQAGTHVEDIVVDKGITLVGSADLMLEADDADAPITVTGDGAILQDLFLDGPQIGVIVDGGSDVSLTGFEIRDARQWALAFINASGAQVSDGLITGAGSGGISVEGGSVSVTSVEVSDSEGYGLLAATSAAVVVSGSTFRDITRSSGSADDGVGIAADTASLETSGNVIEVANYGVLGISSTMVLADDSITGGIFGVLANETDLVASGLDITDPYYCGLYAYSPTLTEISDTTIVGTPGEVFDPDPDTWGDAAYQSAGAFIIAPDVVVSDTSITGYSGVGMLVGANSGGDADLRRLTLTDQGHYGLYLSAIDTRAEDVVVSGTYAITNDLSTLCTEVGTDIGVLVYDGELDWSGGSVSDVEGYGISNVYGTLEIDGAAISGTTCGGVMAFQGDARITYSDFSDAGGGAFAGSVVAYQDADLYVGGSTFSDSQNEDLDRSTESVIGGVRTRYDYYEWLGSDIQVWYGATATITQNTFERGVNGVELYGDISLGFSTANLSNNSFTDYKGLATYVGDGCSATVTDQTISQHGPYTMACESGSLDLTRVSVETGGTSVARTSVYEDDVFVYDLELESTGPSVFSSACDFSADGLTVVDADTTAVFLQNGSWQLEDVTVIGAGLAEDGDGIYATSTSSSAAFYADGVDVSGVLSGRGIYLLAGTTINATIFDTKVSNTSSDGILLENSSSSSSASAALTSLTVTNAGGNGLHVDGFGLSMDGVVVTGSGADGIVVTGGTATASDSSSTSNGGFGVVCEDSVSFSTCEIEVVDNLEGDFDGCDSVCTGDEDTTPKR